MKSDGKTLTPSPDHGFVLVLRDGEHIRTRKGYDLQILYTKESGVTYVGNDREGYPFTAFQTHLQAIREYL